MIDRNIFQPYLKTNALISVVFHPTQTNLEKISTNNNSFAVCFLKIF